MRKTKAITQCLAIQDLIHDAAMTFKAALQSKGESASLDVKTAVALSRLAIAWNAIAERARILRGRPLPGSFRPKPPKQKPRPPFAGMPVADWPVAAPGPWTTPPPVPPVAANSSSPKVEPAKPLQPPPCPVCGGRTKIRVSGGNTMACQACRGTGQSQGTKPRSGL